MSVTIHHGASFVVADETGDIAPSSECGFFHLDTRFLSRHELRVDGRCPILLQARVTRANEAWHHLTNPALEGAPRSTLGIAVQRVVGGGLRESIEVENFSGHEARLELGLSFGCDFAYILTVKKQAGGGDGGWHPNIHASVRGDREVRFELDREGAPHRSTLTFDHPPAGLSQDAARFLLRLAPRQRWTATLDLAPSVGEERARVRPPSAERADALRHRRHALGRSMPRVEADHAVLERAADPSTERSAPWTR